MGNIFWLVVLLVLIALFGVMIGIGSRKKRWEKIYLANNDVMCLYRTKSDYWFRDRRDMSSFRDISGRYVMLSNRFTLKREEISEDEVPAVVQQIVAMIKKREEGG